MSCGSCVHPSTRLTSTASPTRGQDSQSVMHSLAPSAQVTSCQAAGGIYPYSFQPQNTAHEAYFLASPALTIESNDSPTDSSQQQASTNPGVPTQDAAVGINLGKPRVPVPPRSKCRSTRGRQPAPPTIARKANARTQRGARRVPINSRPHTRRHHGLLTAEVLLGAPPKEVLQPIDLDQHPPRPPV